MPQERLCSSIQFSFLARFGTCHALCVCYVVFSLLQRPRRQAAMHDIKDMVAKEATDCVTCLFLTTCHAHVVSEMKKDIDFYTGDVFADSRLDVFVFKVLPFPLDT